MQALGWFILGALIVVIIVVVVLTYLENILFP